MRVLHTADWHLGHTLHDLPRDREHGAFLAWLLDTIVAERIDALLVAGDVFDAGNPPASALAAWYGFLAEAHRRRPRMVTVAIAGNHDSPSRLTAPAELLGGVRARVIGAVPRGGDPDALVIPLPDADGRIGAWLAAVPYLRPGDLDERAEGERTAAVRAVHAAAIARARARRGPGQALLAMGHLHVAGAEASLSERRIAIGGLEATAAAFGDDVAYVALGHLHRAQRAGAPHVRYAGSPIPLAMAEADYRHGVVVVELDGERLSGIRTLDVPRTVELVRVPARGPASLDEVLAALVALPPLDRAVDAELRPFLEVRVRLARPEPRLRVRIEEAVRDRHARLVKITTEGAGDRRALAEATPAEALAELDPREVLRRRWQRDHAGDVPPPIVAAFDALVREVTEAPP